MRALVVALLLVGGLAAVVPGADAMPYCDFRTICPGLVCIGSGDDHGYRACVGPGYCDPAACDPWVP